MDTTRKQSTIKCTKCGLVKTTVCYFKVNRNPPVCKACSDYKTREGKTIALEKINCNHCGVLFNRVVGEKHTECFTCKSWKKSIRGVLSR